MFRSLAMLPIWCALLQIATFKRLSHPERRTSAIGKSVMFWRYRSWRALTKDVRHWSEGSRTWRVIWDPKPSSEDSLQVYIVKLGYLIDRIALVRLLAKERLEQLQKLYRSAASWRVGTARWKEKKSDMLVGEKLFPEQHTVRLILICEPKSVSYCVLWHIRIFIFKLLHL